LCLSRVSTLEGDKSEIGETQYSGHQDSHPVGLVVNTTKRVRFPTIRKARKDRLSKLCLSRVSTFEGDKSEISETLYSGHQDSHPVGLVVNTTKQVRFPTIRKAGKDRLSKLCLSRVSTFEGDKSGISETLYSGHQD
jgi:hypothetical protein